MPRFQEHKGLDLAQVAQEILETWREEGTFARSIALREGCPRFVFYEGPPSANGLPGIHHVMARTLKDVFCRYKTQQGFLVDRKAGWDTHGLPVELGVEAMLGITKEDIGRSISVEEYNRTCRQEVMKYTDKWRELTEMMGYWVDMEAPYVTYHNQYIESLWHLLQKLFDAGLLYKGKTIQPYSPAAGTGLSTHELNQPGCYREVSDTSVTVLFAAHDAQGEPMQTEGLPTCVLAWTTTPWTLPSNTALAVGENIDYEFVSTYNPYTGAPFVAIIASARIPAYFKADGSKADMVPPSSPQALLPWRSLRKVKGRELVGLHYAPVFPWVRPEEGAYRIIPADFVTTEDGTGIVHVAPTFGADDARAAKAHGIPPMVLKTTAADGEPMVDRTGRFSPLEDLDPDFVAQRVNADLYRPWGGRFVKGVYTSPDDPMGGDLNVDLCVELKQQGLAFRIEKFKHSYPHCWRTDKPVLYYPLDSWFIRTTALRDRMLELNATINWKPEATGTGRFGKWLENLVDWNLSRSRFWGTPLPIWATDDRQELRCIGSVEELKFECEKAVQAGIMATNPLAHFTPRDLSESNYNTIDLHRPFVDNIVLVSPSGKPMRREPDLIDVWFDSGAMPYAQWHYPFEHQEEFNAHFPADFIAEGVDQTRGWFFTLHAIATMVSDSVAFRNIISNGLLLDKNGNKMSKRLGNAVDPFAVMQSTGPDALRWYMITNSQPWENLKFDRTGVEEVMRKFFGTLFNTYAFFSLYANVDGFTGDEPQVPLSERTELDRWILSKLHSLVTDTVAAFDDYEPTRAGRAIQDFTTEHLSNWYVRLNRKRFWGGGLTQDKLAAYQTLYECLETITRLMAPIAPFYAERLHRDLHPATSPTTPQSVHLTQYPQPLPGRIDAQLERRMDLAQRITSLVLALRRKVSIKVRQPLARIMVPVLNEEMGQSLRAVESIILAEVNVRSIEYLNAENSTIVKRLRPDFKKLGPRFGPAMKELASQLNELSQSQIAHFEAQGSTSLSLRGESVTVQLDEVEILPEDIPGWLVATDGPLTVALDISLTEELLQEGAAREMVNRVQNLRKASGLEITDRIVLHVAGGPKALAAIRTHADYVKVQTLADDLREYPTLPDTFEPTEVALDDSMGSMRIAIERNA